MVDEAKIKVTLDTTEARREIKELQKERGKSARTADKGKIIREQITGKKRPLTPAGRTAEKVSGIKTARISAASAVSKVAGTALIAVAVAEAIKELGPFISGVISESTKSITDRLEDAIEDITSLKLDLDISKNIIDKTVKDIEGLSSYVTSIIPATSQTISIARAASVLGNRLSTSEALEFGKQVFQIQQSRDFANRRIKDIEKQDIGAGFTRSFIDAIKNSLGR